MNKPNFSRKAASLAIIAAAVVFFLALGYFVGVPLIKTASDPEKFKALVGAHGFAGKLYYILIVAFQVVIAIVPGEPIEIGGGYAFGPIQGMALALIGCAVGSTIAFFLTRRFGQPLLDALFPDKKHEKLERFKNHPRLVWILFLLFFIPGTPKDVVTYFAGLTNIRFFLFLFVSTFARIPSVITSTVGGSALGEQSYLFAVIVFAATAAVSVAGIFFYGRFFGKKD